MIISEPVIIKCAIILIIRVSKLSVALRVIAPAFQRVFSPYAFNDDWMCKVSKCLTAVLAEMKKMWLVTLSLNFENIRSSQPSKLRNEFLFNFFFHLLILRSKIPLGELRILATALRIS